MKLDLSLEEMSQEEKLLLLENIWDNLKESEESFSSPDWHQEILKKRKKKAEAGESEFIDWGKAKENIRKAVQ